MNKPGDSKKLGDSEQEVSRSSLFDGLIKRAGKVAGGTLDLAVDVATMSAMFGDSRIRDLLSSSASPERLNAMADAGMFLRDARETAGLSIRELAERLELRDDSVLEGVERGEAILPLEFMLRAVSLLARHDPVPFLIKFLRSYNPQLEATLEQWGVMALPKNYERERRFVNLYRQHDFLRELDDDAYQRFIEYMDSSTQLVVDVMQRESAAPRAPRKAGSRKAADKAQKQGSDSVKAKPATKPARKRASSGTAASKRKSSESTTRQRPVVRKVKPRSRDS